MTLHWESSIDFNSVYIYSHNGRTGPEDWVRISVP